MYTGIDENTKITNFERGKTVTSINVKKMSYFVSLIAFFQFNAAFTRTNFF